VVGKIHKPEISILIKRKMFISLKKGSSFQITQEIQEYDNWNLNNLKNRHERLINNFLDIFLV
jgi:hypothetical protein